MKKTLLLIVMIMLPMVVNADAVEINGIYFNLNSEDNSAEVTYKSSGKYEGEIAIPSTVTYNSIEYSVTSIGKSAFRNCSGLTSVTIPNSIKSIGYCAFLECNLIIMVDISDIAAWCKILFDGGYSNPLYYSHDLYLNGKLIKDLMIPGGVTSIGEYAFIGCSGLTSVTIPNSVTSISEYTFSGCSGLISIIIPNCVTRINLATFSGCTGLTSIEIPSSVTSIEDAVFSGCTGLTSINIPNSVTYIGGSAFYS